MMVARLPFHSGLKVCYRRAISQHLASILLPTHGTRIRTGRCGIGMGLFQVWLGRWGEVWIVYK